MSKALAQGVVWVMNQQGKLKVLAVRAGSFYLGYRILHHEIWEQETAEPLLVFVGMWLCGIAPATFFDQLRKVGESIVEVKAEIEQTSKAAIPPGLDPEKKGT